MTTLADFPGTVAVSRPLTSITALSITLSVTRPGLSPSRRSAGLCWQFAASTFTGLRTLASHTGQQIAKNSHADAVRPFDNRNLKLKVSLCMRIRSVF